MSHFGSSRAQELVARIYSHPQHILVRLGGRDGGKL